MERALVRTSHSARPDLVGEELPWPLLHGVPCTGLLDATSTFARGPVGIADIRFSGNWTCTGLTLDEEPVATLVRTISAQETPGVVADLAEAVRLLHRTSGLTWDQLGKLFGVSRRAVHHWAAGGRMNAANADRLNRLIRIVGNLPAATPDPRRSAILAPSGVAGSSLFDSLRSEEASRPDDVNAPSGSVEQRLGARHDR